MPETLTKKPPVVAVLGHIDHGKTSLLDAIRKTNVTQKEAGGITQSIGAYQVKVKSKTEDRIITFIDTPGHEAFQKMRSHGARAADMALLVVAADEGVKPQTLEALEDIKKAAIPFIVVLNKIDKPEANIQRVKQDLATKGVLVEGWGGQVPVMEVSALKGKGIPELLDLILLLADVEELSANKNKAGEGVVISSGIDSKRGTVATFIVKDGTLKKGDWVRLESAYGKIKLMENFDGKAIAQASPSMPVLVLGLKEIPSIGESFFVVSSEKEARDRQTLEKVSDLPKALVPVSNQVVKLILKSKEKASLEAFVSMIKDCQRAFPETSLTIIASEVGDISTSDIDTARHFNAVILGFRISVTSQIKNIMRQQGVEYKIIEIIYEVCDVIKQIIEGRFIKQKTPELLGELAVLATYVISKKGQVIGGKVVKGVVKKNTSFDIKRGEDMMGKGEIRNLQQEKKDASVVEKGKECGLLIQASVPIEVNDILIFFS